ncbi:MAG: CPCC family cysteine-rich protein [Armatimonadota bacterium]
MTQNQSELHPCPVCKAKVISEIGKWEICPICGWEDDPGQQKHPSTTGGANDLSLDEARLAWWKREQADKPDRDN